MNKIDTYEILTVLMFWFVGLYFFSYQKCLDWSKENGKDWYYKRKWSSKRKSMFRRLAIFVVRRRNPHYTKEHASNAVGWFLFHQGWSDYE